MNTIRIGDEDVAVTDWFDGTVEPTREGVYERSYPGGPYSCWNGRAWNDDAPSPSAAATRTGASEHPAASWRGLVQKTGLPCATCRGRTVIDHGVDEDTGLDRIVECPEC